MEPPITFGKHLIATSDLKLGHIFPCVAGCADGFCRRRGALHAHKVFILTPFQIILRVRCNRSRILTCALTSVGWILCMYLN